MNATARILPLHNPNKVSPNRKKIALQRELFNSEIESLGDEDLLGMVIGGGLSAKERAKNLLEIFGSIHGVERAIVKELICVGGLGPKRASALKAAFALGRRVAGTERSRGERIRSAEDIHNRLSPILRHIEREIFIVILLDSRHRVLREVKVAQGGLAACGIQPRDVLEPAVRESAAAVIFAHNHPSGDPTPSTEDVALTRRLCVAADALGIRALDHVVVGDGRYISFSEEGLIGSLK